MLRFQHISHLLALGLLPLLIAAFVWMLYWRKNKLQKLGEARLINDQLMGYIPGRSTLRFVLLTIAFALIAIGWANLQKGSKTENIERKGVDVVIALDVSRSMLASDIQPDRLTRSKQLIMRMMDKLKNDRVALIVFAGRAYLQVPLTIDYGAMKMMLQNVKPDLIPTQGTVISDAVTLAMKSFSQKEKKYKSLVIISDGEDHDELAIAKTKEAHETGVIVHTIGVGSPQGATLIDPATKAPKMDEQGNPVVTKLNEAALKDIAAAGKGSYSLLQNTDAVAEKLAGEIDNMEQNKMGTVSYVGFNSYFQYFLLIAFILLVIESILPGAFAKPKKHAA
jgi:Ca-activated chloride channel family protein